MAAVHFPLTSNAFVDVNIYDPTRVILNAKHISSTKYSQMQSGLSVAFAPATNYQAYSSTYSEGVKMLVHERLVYPSDLSVEKMISHRSETYIRIVPTLTMCAQSVQSLSPDDRECLFVPERQLE